jgi:hypothetical protein
MWLLSMRTLTDNMYYCEIQIMVDPPTRKYFPCHDTIITRVRRKTVRTETVRNKNFSAM